MSKGEKLNPIVEAAKLRIFEPRPREGVDSVVTDYLNMDVRADEASTSRDVSLDIYSAKLATKRSEMDIKELQELNDYHEVRDLEEDRVLSSSPIRRMSERAQRKLDDREIKAQIKEGTEIAKSWSSKEKVPQGYRAGVVAQKVRSEDLEIV